jgi:hypothetical protein
MPRLEEEQGRSRLKGREGFQEGGRRKGQQTKNWGAGEVEDGLGFSF